LLLFVGNIKNYITFDAQYTRTIKKAHQWSERTNCQCAVSFCKLLPKYTIKEKVIKKSIKKKCGIYA
jgi:hypothetical protein